MADPLHMPGAYTVVTVEAAIRDDGAEVRHAVLRPAPLRLGNGDLFTASGDVDIETDDPEEWQRLTLGATVYLDATTDD